MPFYDLHCPKCDEEFNISASVADKKGKRVPCPVCGSLDLETVYRAGPAYIRTKTANMTSMPVCPHSEICGGCKKAV